MKILMFSPSNAVWNWAYPTALVAESLQKKGDEVWLLTCEREYSKFCMAQAATGVQFTSSDKLKDLTCSNCISKRDLLTSKLKLNTLIINNFLTPQERTTARQIADNVNLDNYENYSIAGVQVGRLAMYEVIIQNKKQALNFSSNEWIFYKEILFNVSKTVMAFRKVIEQIKPDVCIIEHTAYSYNRACQLLSSINNIPSYCINGNSYNNAHCFELQTIAKDDPIIFVQNYLKMWPNVKHLPISLEEASFVTDHFISLMAARGHVYSTAKTNNSWSIRKKFNIRADQKILLATTSSLDEMFATEAVGNFAWNTKSTVFESQVEWIKYLLQYIQTRPDLFLVIRIHPREFMPGQNGEISEHAKKLQVELKSLPNNAVINWPKDSISIYDLMEETDVVLNAWSTAGLEMTYLGIPVVVYCGHMLLYPDELTYSAKNREEYFTFIDHALRDGWSFERMKMAYRWCVTQHLRVSVNISESFPYNILKKKSFISRAIQKIGSIVDPLFREKLQIRSRTNILKSVDQVRKLLIQNKNTFLDLTPPSNTIDKEDEIAAIKLEIERLYKNVYGNLQSPTRENTLQQKLWSLIKN